jgi:bifunctional DNA-binding transcriptional regulator/antitoxin component of YhaV-PrlF toxin-antitoxin module
MESSYLTVQKRGLISLPADLRRRHHLDEPGAQVEVRERSDGVIELRAHVPVPAEQRWFWSDRWQEMEREAEADVRTGRVETFEGPEEFLADLDRD